MRRRRLVLALVSVASLVVLVYAGVLTAFSIPVTPEMEAAARLPGAAEPAVGQRVLVVPVPDPTLLGTVAQDGNGTLILVGESGTFPSGARDASIVRALAYVAPTANGSYFPATLTLNVTRVDANGSATRENVTFDVAALAGGRAGFLVKGDAEPSARFAETSRVVGHVARFEPGVGLVTLFALGATGFAAPLLVLIFTHRASGRPGVQGVPAGVCRECRAPLAASAGFCYRCGALVEGGS